MSRLPSCTATQVIRVLKRAGFVFDHATGSHQAFRRPGHPGSVVVAFHRGELKRGTLNGILKQAGLTPEGFIKLLRG
jgi:predicted RNA binding protein YcfA (HicA-like mRNA interferase family)